MRLLVSFLTTITITIISDVESFDHSYRLAKLMRENNITLPERTHKSLNFGNISRHCKNTTKPCLWKCCKFGESFRDERCVPSKLDYMLKDVIIYDSNLQRTDKFFQDTFQLVPNHFSNKDFRKSVMEVSLAFPTYLSEDGVLIIEYLNQFNRFSEFTVDRFCVDVDYKKPSLIVFYGAIFDVDFSMESFNTRSLLYRQLARLLCMTLLIYVLAMYCIRPHLRDLHGMLMITLICCCLIKIIIQFVMPSRAFYSILCSICAQSLYMFCSWATFSFTNVMFYNVWKSIRSGGTVNSRLNKFKQYTKYIVYGFGLPLILTVMTVVLDFIDMSSIPWFITPKLYMPINIGKEMIFYIYIPGSIMFLYNIFLCCLIMPKAYEGFFGSHPMAYIYNDAIKYDVISFSQCLKLMTFMIISEAANAYSLWEMKLYGIATTNIWLLGVVIILIFLRGSDVKRQRPTTAVNQDMISMTEMQ